LLLIFPELRYNYENSTAKIELKSMGDPFTPSFEIIDGETYLTSMVRINIIVESDEGQDVEIIALDTRLDSTLNFQVKKGFVIDPDITTLKITVLKIVGDLTKSVVLEDLNTIIGTVTGFIRNYANM